KRGRRSVRRASLGAIMTRMGSVVRPGMLKAALAAKLAAAASQLLALREAEQPRLTPHLDSPRQIIAAFLPQVDGVYPIVDAFGRANAGELVFKAWYENWRAGLSKIDLALWGELRVGRDQLAQGHSPKLIEDSIAVTDPTATVPGRRTEARKQRLRFAAYP